MVDNPDKKNKGIQDVSQQQDSSNNNDVDKSWFRRSYEKYNPSLTLENNASVARDHLANERTFLAWLRTSLSFISIGVAITQLFRLTNSSPNNGRTTRYDKGGKPLGIVFMILGIIFLTFGIARYFHSQYLMTKGHFPASRGSVIIGTILTVIVLSACFIVIVIFES